MPDKECYLRHISSDTKLSSETDCSVFYCSSKLSALIETQFFNFGTWKLLIFSNYHSLACIKLIQLGLYYIRLLYLIKCCLCCWPKYKRKIKTKHWIFIWGKNIILFFSETVLNSPQPMYYVFIKEPFSKLIKYRIRIMVKSERSWSCTVSYSIKYSTKY